MFVYWKRLTKKEAEKVPKRRTWDEKIVVERERSELEVSD